MTTPELITPIEAFEGWRFFAPLVRTKNKEPLLGSCNHNVLWPKRERLEAFCKFPDEKAPFSCKEFIEPKEEKYDRIEMMIELIFSEDGGVEVGAGRHECRKISTVHKFTPGHEDVVPSREGHCGIYGCKTQADLLHQGFFNGKLFGTASFWGRMVEGATGYRAQFCYPKTIVGGLCSECGKTLDLTEVALYRFIERRRSRYVEGVQKYAVLCGGCFEKEPRKPSRSLLGKKRDQYLNALAEGYGISINQSFTRA